MPKKKERRKWARKTKSEPEVGILHGRLKKKKGRASAESLFVGVHNHCPGGLLVDSAGKLEAGTQFSLSLFDADVNRWVTHQAQVAWIKPSNKGNDYLAGLEFVKPSDLPKQKVVSPPGEALDDLGFLMSTRLLESIPKHAVWSLLNCLTPSKIMAGKKFISQGEKGKSLFLIQSGTCVVQVERDGEVFPVAHLSDGDVVGEMAVLTGEPRYAEVVAESDMKVWELGKKQFDAVSIQYPDLRMFLTDLVTDRLEKSPHTADRTIGKYLIKIKLGQGAWSIVYHGVHQVLNMAVAIKMLKHRMAMDEDFNERFKNEAQLIAQMNHRNIVQVYDIEELYQTLFIIMEYLEGEPLEDMLKRTGALPVARVVNFVSQICAGLSYAHTKGIVHQDIKPANILVMADDRIKILDFGLACTTGCEGLDLEGTIFYMAPEQIEGEAVDARTDIYNLGISTFEMVVGKRPYPEDDLVNLMDMHLEKDIPDPGKLVPGLPEELRRFIVKSCERNPNKRYQSMEDALAELAPLLQEEAAGVVSGKGIEQRQMSTLFFFYKDEQRVAMNQLLEEFSSKAADQGIMIKAAEFKDLC